MILKNRWWMRDVFALHIRLPFFELDSAIMQRSMIDMSYIYLSFHLKIIKWKFEFVIGDSFRRLAKKDKNDKTRKYNKKTS